VQVENIGIVTHVSFLIGVDEDEIERFLNLECFERLGRRSEDDFDFAF
jgi:hypothetical protein